LQDGSTLTLGDYEIAIEIDGGTSARKAPSPGGREEELFPHSAESQASLDRLFNEREDAIPSPPKAPRSMESERIDDWLDLPDPDTSDLIPEDWDPLGDEARADEDAIAGHRLVDEETPTNRVAEKHISSTDAPKLHRAGDQAAVAAFLRGAGLSDLDLAESDVAELMEGAGKMLHELVGGLMEVLADRRVLKDEFRLSQTQIKSSANNPLKFLPTPDEALRTLLTHRGPAYMEPVEAVREGLEDLRAHQMAVIVGTQAALRSLLQRFDPQTLEQRLGSHSLMERLLSGGRKKRCWDMFRDLYDEIAQEAQDDYEKLFGREFSRAYEEQVRKR
jgi:type VI secretion system protein